MGFHPYSWNRVIYTTIKFTMTKVILLLKGPCTVVADKTGVFLADTGTPGMATAGSGDVLAGILGGIMVQKQNGCKNVLQFVAECVYLHGYAGDLAAKRVGEHAMVAGDMIESLKEISKEGL